MTTNSAFVGADRIAEAAERLLDAQRYLRPCAPVRDLIGSTDVAAAYAVQTKIVKQFLAQGRRLVGRKVGLTSPAVQAQLGVDQPDFGVLFADMECPSGGPIDAARLLQPKVEAEIAFILSRDIDAEVDAQSAREYVEYAVAALEIVDSRVAGWDITFGDTVADNASSGLFVLGDVIPNDRLPNLETVTMALTADGRVVSEGVGADCLGSPWQALAWLANTARQVGAPLKAGEVVLSGALGPMAPVTAGITYTATITGIGSVQATLGNITAGARQ